MPELVRLAPKLGRQCPTCGHPVASIFDHIDIDCEHGMAAEQVAELLRLSEDQAKMDDSCGR